ncbi:unnamed protein product [Schistosoma turkestanicum]|nr:unnamed protein product [Schistosoma turkestanicum]
MVNMKFCWITLLFCCPALFLTNTVAQETKMDYEHNLKPMKSDSFNQFQSIFTDKDILSQHQMKFELVINCEKFKHVGIFSNGTVFLTSGFQPGNEVRSFQITDVEAMEDEFQILSTVGVTMAIHQNGTIQYSLNDGLTLAPTDNMRIRIWDGILGQRGDTRKTNFSLIILWHAKILLKQIGSGQVKYKCPFHSFYDLGIHIN